MKYVLAFAAATVLAAGAAFAGEKGEKMMDFDAKFDAHFKDVDVNADNQVTEQEVVDYHVAKAKKEFAAMAGGDGVATYEEAKAHHKAKHAEMMKEHASMQGAMEDTSADKSGEH
jgi:hypothetical protein